MTRPEPTRRIFAKQSHHGHDHDHDRSGTRSKCQSGNTSDRPQRHTYERENESFSSYSGGSSYIKWTTVILAIGLVVSIGIQVGHISQTFSVAQTTTTTATITNSTSSNNDGGHHNDSATVADDVASSISRLIQHNMEDDLSFRPPPPTTQVQAQVPVRSVETGSGPSTSASSRSWMTTTTTSSPSTTTRTTSTIVPSAKQIMTPTPISTHVAARPKWMDIILDSAGNWYNATGQATGGKNRNSKYDGNIDEGKIHSLDDFDYRTCTSPEYHSPLNVNWPFSADEVTKAVTSGLPKRTQQRIVSSRSNLIHTTTSDLDPSFTCATVTNNWWPNRRKRTGKSRNGTVPSIQTTTTSFADYFYQVVWKSQIVPLLKEDDSSCNEMIVFGVAFGSKFVRQVVSTNNLRHVNTTQLLSRHGSCFFMFTTVEDLVDGHLILDDGSTNGSNVTHATYPVGDMLPSLTPFRSADQPFWWIPIPKMRLPYVNPRRNVKLIKYFVGGQFAAPLSKKSTSPLARTVIWQDAKFFRPDRVRKLPKDDYTSVLESSFDACFTAIGLPVHRFTVGKDHPTPTDPRLKQRYAYHCRAIIKSFGGRRPKVTDSPHSLIYQCLAYLSALHEQDGGQSSVNDTPHGSLTSQLDYGLVDTAFLIWNESSERCRKFNSQFRCSIQSQLHCHSDRDQTNLPFVLMNMNVTGFYQDSSPNITRTVDGLWNPRSSDVEYYVNSELSEQMKHRAAEQAKVSATDVLDRLEPVVRILRYSCHWYYSRVGDGCMFWKLHRRTLRR